MMCINILHGRKTIEEDMFLTSMGVGMCNGDWSLSKLMIVSKFVLYL
jgi:hypothetical protein